MLYEIPLLCGQEFVLFDQRTFEWLTAEPYLAKIDFINHLESHSSGDIVMENIEGEKILLADLLLHKFFKPFSTILRKENLYHLNGNCNDFRLENLEYKIVFQKV